MVDRYVKIDLDRDECEAIAELAEIAVQQILRNELFMAKRDQDKVRALINRVKVKMSQAVILFDSRPGARPGPSLVLPGKKWLDG